MRDVCHRIQIRLASPDLMPLRTHPDDAGYDLMAADGLILNPGERQLVSTGVFLGLKPGFEAQIRPRSGLAAKYGITVVNSPGTVDAGYRGEVKVILLNTGNEKLHINRLDRIAQMVICRLPTVGLDIVDELDDTDRGDKGYGSSGR